MIVQDFFNRQILSESVIADSQEVVTPQNIEQFNTADNRREAYRIWGELVNAYTENVGIVTIEFPNAPAVTLTRNQVYTVVERIGKMSGPQQHTFGLTTIINRPAFLQWLAGLKIKPRPKTRQPSATALMTDPTTGQQVVAKQQSLDLREREKSPAEPKDKFKDVSVARAMRQAVADFPAAASDTEAFIKSMLVSQDEDQKNIQSLRASTQRQRELLAKNIDQDKKQQDTISNINQEIDKVERENNSLEQMQKQMVAANARLQQTLDQMRRKGQKQTAQSTDDTAQHKQRQADDENTQRLVKMYQDLQQQLRTLQAQNTAVDTQGIENKLRDIENKLRKKSTAPKQMRLNLPTAMKNVGRSQPTQAMAAEVHDIPFGAMLETMNRAGYNALRDVADYADKKTYLQSLLNDPAVPEQDRQVVKQRLLDLDDEARKKGFAK